MKKVRVKTAGRSYPVVIGNDLSEELNRLLEREVGQARLFVFYDANFYALHGVALRRAINLPDRRLREFVIPSGERRKSARTLAGLHDFLLNERVTREDFILACGGGVTSDLTGYAAATILRGVRWGVLPTTLLGMVDAAIGGKTGINHARGKNLIGAFWQPSFVCSDVRFLATLPPRHLIAGLGEILKTAGLAGGRLVSDLERLLAMGLPCEGRALTNPVGASAAYKAKIVERDEREAGRRLVLNYGHTFAHAIEQATGYGRLLHGEAVVLGVDAALALGERVGYRSRSLGHYRVLVGRLLPYLPRRTVAAEAVLDAMALDKKRSGADQRYVILARIGQPVVHDRISRQQVRAALTETLGRYQSLGGKRAR